MLVAAGGPRYLPHAGVRRRHPASYLASATSDGVAHSQRIYNGVAEPQITADIFSIQFVSSECRKCMKSIITYPVGQAY